MSDFIFNGISAASMGLTIERYPSIDKPRKRIESVSVPGRSGDLHIWDGSFEDVTVRYVCWFKASKSFDIARRAHDIAEWLYTAPVGARLEDTYDSRIYRLATWVGGVNVENVLGRHGRITLDFRCSPQGYIKSAETGMTFIRSGGAINNECPFYTKPLIRIVGSIGGLLTIGDRSLKVMFPGTETHEFWLDCPEQEAWEVVDGVEVPANAWVSTVDFLEVAPGVNTVTFPASFESVMIKWRPYLL